MQPILAAQSTLLRQRRSSFVLVVINATDHLTPTAAQRGSSRRAARDLIPCNVDGAQLRQLCQVLGQDDEAGVLVSAHVFERELRQATQTADGWCDGADVAGFKVAVVQVEVAQAGDVAERGRNRGAVIIREKVLNGKGRESGQRGQRRAHGREPGRAEHGTVQVEAFERRARWRETARAG